MKKNKALFIFAFSAMLMMGFIDSFRGPLIPGIKAAFGISYSNVGVIFFAAGLGFLIATFFSGMLCDRLGEKKVAFFGFICVISGIAGISFSQSFGIFLFMMGFLNIGLGSIEIGVNSLISGIVVSNQAIIMNLLHFFYGVGASIGPRYSGQLLNMSMGWRGVYAYSLILASSIFAYFIFVRFPVRSVHGRSESVPVMDVIKNKKVWLFGASLGFYVACELGVSNWFVNYLAVVYNMNELKGSIYLSIYFIVFTAGRLVGGFIAEKLGYFNSVLTFMIASLVLFSLGALVGGKLVVLISMCGLSYSIVFPTLVSAVIKEFKKSTGSVLGIVITMSSGISMVLNWFIGKLNDVVSVKFGFSIIIAYIACVLVLVTALKILTLKQSTSSKDILTDQGMEPDTGIDSFH